MESLTGLFLIDEVVELLYPALVGDLDLLLLSFAARQGDFHIDLLLAGIIDRHAHGGGLRRIDGHQCILVVADIAAGHAERCFALAAGADKRRQIIVAGLYEHLHGDVGHRGDRTDIPAADNRDAADVAVDHRHRVDHVDQAVVDDLGLKDRGALHIFGNREPRHRGTELRLGYHNT